MAFISTFVIGYLLGGLTLFPALLAIYVYLPTNTIIISIQQTYRQCMKLLYNPTTTTTTSTIAALDEKHNNNPAMMGSSPLYKVGWLRMTQGKAPTISLKKPSQRPYFAVLKYQTLYLYDSDQQLDCQQVLALQHYKVEMYPPDILDAELFSRPHWIQLTRILQDERQPSPASPASLAQPTPIPRSRSTTTTPNSLFSGGGGVGGDDDDDDDDDDDNDDSDHDSDSYHTSKTSTNMSTIYLHCHLCTEKEDWYQLLMQASGRPRQPVTMGSLQPLIRRVHGDGDQLELQWFNALLGRLFLGIHQSERFRQSVWTKVMTKVDKINARRPPFLGEIQVRAVDIGGNLPLLTRPRLVSLTPQGECKMEAMIDYQGADLHIEIATVLQWSYSDRLPPLTMDIVLRVTLQSLKGKLNVVIKPPPCNRLWYGFDGLPDMKWHIAPLVWETKVGHSMVVKAIIKHLEEVFRDTMVLPHMDDITFFDSDGLGGIYQQEKTEKNGNDISDEDGNRSDDDDNGDHGDDQDGAFDNHSDSSSEGVQHHHMGIHGAGATRYTTTTTNGLFDKRPLQPPPPLLPKANLTQSPTTSSLTSNQQKQRPKSRSGKKLDPQKKSASTTTASKRSSTSTSATTPVPIHHHNNKKNGKKAKRQEDIKLLSTARSFPELISAHNNYATTAAAAVPPLPPQQQPVLVPSSSTSSTTSSSGSSSQVPTLSISPNTTATTTADITPPPGLYFSTSTSTTSDAYSTSPPTLRPRRSFANLGQKTSASTAVSQVNTAAGLFAGKQQQQQQQQSHVVTR